MYAGLLCVCAVCGDRRRAQRGESPAEKRKAGRVPTAIQRAQVQDCAVYIRDAPDGTRRHHRPHERHRLTACSAWTRVDDKPTPSAGAERSCRFYTACATDVARAHHCRTDTRIHIAPVRLPRSSTLQPAWWVVETIPPRPSCTALEPHASLAPHVALATRCPLHPLRLSTCLTIASWPALRLPLARAARLSAAFARSLPTPVPIAGWEGHALIVGGAAAVASASAPLAASLAGLLGLRALARLTAPARVRAMLALAREARGAQLRRHT